MREAGHVRHAHQVLAAPAGEVALGVVVQDLEAGPQARDPGPAQVQVILVAIDHARNDNVLPGQLEMYAAYGGRDEFNIGAQVESLYSPESNDRFIRITRADGGVVYASGPPRGDIFDPIVAMKLHDYVFSSGCRRDSEEAYKGFRGHAEKPGALLRKRGLADGPRGET